MPLELLVFDLDGTLIDSREDLADSVNATRANADLGPLPNQTIYGYVGNGAPMLVKRALGEGKSEQEVEAGLEFFLAYYREHMLDKTYLYPGVREALDQWKDSGYVMAVLTNKPVRFSEGIMEGLGLTNHFVRIYGGNSFPTKKPDPEGLRAIMAESGFGPADTWMVGDSWVDVQTARNAETNCCGVSYGLQPESLKRDVPDVLVDDLRDLQSHLTKEISA